MHFHVSFFSEIRVKNNGFESVEVIDDGTGIEAENFDSLCELFLEGRVKQIQKRTFLRILFVIKAIAFPYIVFHIGQQTRSPNFSWAFRDF